MLALLATWRKVVLAVATTLLSAGAIWAASTVKEELNFFESLHWRVPRVEEKLNLLLKAEETRKELEADRHQQIMEALEVLKARDKKGGGK